MDFSRVFVVIVFLMILSSVIENFCHIAGITKTTVRDGDVVGAAFAFAGSLFGVIGWGSFLVSLFVRPDFYIWLISILIE